jgi:hypothetical protein
VVPERAGRFSLSSLGIPAAGSVGAEAHAARRRGQRLDAEARVRQGRGEVLLEIPADLEEDLAAGISTTTAIQGVSFGMRRAS